MDLEVNADTYILQKQQVQISCIQKYLSHAKIFFAQL